MPSLCDIIADGKPEIDHAGFSVWYLVVVMFADLCFLIAILRLKKGDAAGSSRLFKRAMAVALAAFVVGSLGRRRVDSWL